MIIPRLWLNVNSPWNISSLYSLAKLSLSGLSNLHPHHVLISCIVTMGDVPAKLGSGGERLHSQVPERFPSNRANNKHTFRYLMGWTNMSTVGQVPHHHHHHHHLNHHHHLYHYHLTFRLNLLTNGDNIIPNPELQPKHEQNFTIV